MVGRILAILTLLVMSATSSRAQQCSGYSFGPTGWTLLTPAQVAAQGNVTATITLYANTSDSKPSHNMTVTAGTAVGFQFSSNHYASALAYATVDHGTAHSPEGNWPSSGTTALWWYFDTSHVGHSWQMFYVVTDANGNTTQDMVNVSVVSGSGPSIVNQDGIPNNVYVQVNPNFGGPSMLNACQLCKSGTGQCSGARHTPYLSGSITNHTSGEVQTFQRRAVGTAVDEFTPISGSALWYISTVPTNADTLEVSVTGEIFCSAVGHDIFDSLVSFRIEYGKVVAKDLGHSPRPGLDNSSIYDVAVLCDNNSDPPDWNPTVVHSFSGRHTYWWGVTSLFRAPDVAGVPWIPLSTILTDWSPQPGALTLAKMVIEGGAVPYPGGTGPDFPIPGACTQYPNNVIFTLGSANFPWWPWTPN